MADGAPPSDFVTTSGSKATGGCIEQKVRAECRDRLADLTLYTAPMFADCLEKNDGEHFRPAIQRFLHPSSWAHRIHLMLDNGSSHTSAETTEPQAVPPRVVHSDQCFLANHAKALLEAFSTRYLIRGSWCSPTHMIEHIIASKQEYNQPYAHPFNWHWRTYRDFSDWLNHTPGLIRCKT